MSKFYSARLKLERAERHISELGTIVASIPVNSYSIIKDIDAPTGDHIIRLQSEAVSKEACLIIGDAVTNIRSALDHAFAAAVGAATANTGQCYFPIRDSRRATEVVIDKVGEKLSVSNALRDIILDEIKPYPGGNTNIVVMNKLANIDKHRTIIAVYGIGSITIGPVEFGHNCRIESITVSGKLENGINIARFGCAYKLGDILNAGLDIYFGDAAPPPIVGEPVIKRLREIKREVGAAIDALENHC